MIIHDIASSIGIHSYSGACPGLTGADRAGGMVDVARERTARIMYECMFKNMRYEWKKSECVNAITRSVRTKSLGYREESKSWPPTRRHSSGLTNQCLGRERMSSEGMKNPSFLTGSDNVYTLGWQRFKKLQSFNVSNRGIEPPSRSRIDRDSLRIHRSPKALDAFSRMIQGQQ
jgi:hypothetical protein